MTPSQIRRRSRNAAIAAARLNGASEATVARAHGITPRRVRQVMAELRQAAAPRKSPADSPSGGETAGQPYKTPLRDPSRRRKNFPSDRA